MITTSAQTTNGLTDTELRASPVPVSASSLPLPTGAATETTVATLLQEGTSITGASMPAGGAHGMGWLSAIWKAITDRLPSALVSGRLDVNIGAASGSVPVTDNSGSLTVDAPVGTPVFVRLSDGAAAISTLPVDTELPAAVALSDTLANPTTTPVGACMMVWDSVNSQWTRVREFAGGGLGVTITSTTGNQPLVSTVSADAVNGAVVYGLGSVGFTYGYNGSTWDRVRTVNTGQLKSTLYDASGNAIFPTPAALDDATSNPTTPLLGGAGMLWDPVAAKWRRRITYNRATAFASQNRPASNWDSSVIDAAGMRFLYIYATLSVTGGGTLTIAVNDSSGSFRLATAGTAISTTTPVVYAMGAGLTVPATGLTYVGQVWCLPVPGQFRIRATTTATSTFEVLYELVP